RIAPAGARPLNRGRAAQPRAVHAGEHSSGSPAGAGRSPRDRPHGRARFTRASRGPDYAWFPTASCGGEMGLARRKPFEIAAALAIQVDGWAINARPVVARTLHKERKEPMAKMMTKSQVAAYIANKFDLTKKQGTQILEELATLAAKQAKNGFVFPGVGKLVVVNRKARM